MTRLLVLAVLGVLLWLGVQRAVERLRSLLGPPTRPGRGAPRAAVTETLVRCAGCGVHVPRSRALTRPGSGGECFCSPACRTAAVEPRR